jgi:hypothetical protein
MNAKPHKMDRNLKRKINTDFTRCIGIPGFVEKLSVIITNKNRNTF